MARIIVRVVLFSLSLVDSDRLNFHSRSIKFDIPVELDARDNDDRRVNGAERHLLNGLVFGEVWDDFQRAYASLLFPIPDCDTCFRLGTDCDEQSFILGAEVR